MTGSGVRNIPGRGGRCFGGVGGVIVDGRESVGLRADRADAGDVGAHPEGGFRIALVGGHEDIGALADSEGYDVGCIWFLGICVRTFEYNGEKILTIGTKSFAMMVMLCPSILKRWIPSAPALISRSLCVLPVVNLNFEIPALLVHGVVSPAATVEQSKSIFPLIKLLSDEGAGLPPSDNGVTTDSTISKYSL